MGPIRTTKCHETALPRLSQEMAVGMRPLFDLCRGARVDTVVGQRNGLVSQPSPRERLLDAAQRLSYTHGVNVGVDALLKAANVARRSLYEHFGGKDGLIAEVLRRAAAEDEAHYRAVMAAAGDDPRQRLLAIFDDLDTIIHAPDFRGCRYLGADLALADDDHPAHTVTRQYRNTVHQLLQHEVDQLGHP